ncbi:MAG: hypothetical protein RBR73_09035, partial [Halothiobacillaceae bacterium]|nr:hypothetical protein [Halothiobacillaceae bacterium]
SNGPRWTSSNCEDWKSSCRNIRWNGAYKNKPALLRDAVNLRLTGWPSSGMSSPQRAKGGRIKGPLSNPSSS